MKTEGFTRVPWLACWLRKLGIWVHSLLTEDTSKTEDRLYRFCRRGRFCSAEKKSQILFLGDVEECLGAWLTIFIGFEDDCSRKVVSGSVK